MSTHIYPFVLLLNPVLFASIRNGMSPETLKGEGHPTPHKQWIPNVRWRMLQKNLNTFEAFSWNRAFFCTISPKFSCNGRVLVRGVSCYLNWRFINRKAVEKVSLFVDFPSCLVKFQVIWKFSRSTWLFRGCLEFFQFFWKLSIWAVWSHSRLFGDFSGSRKFLILGV